MENYEEEFRFLRNDIKKIERGEHETNKLFIVDLFKNTSIFLHSLFKSGTSVSLNENKAMCLPKEVITNEEKDEKRDVLRSLYDYTKKNSKKTKGLHTSSNIDLSQEPSKFKFKGGEIILGDNIHLRPERRDLRKPSNQEYSDYVEIDKRPYRDFDDYLKDLGSCQVCLDELKVEKNIPVVEVGSKGAGVKILFVGYKKALIKSGPTKRCFTDEQANLLDRMIAAMKLRPTEVGISTIIKCSFKEEDCDNFGSKIIERCFDNFYDEIFLLKPQIVVTIGAQATNALLGTHNRLARVHGKFFNKSIKYSSGELHKFKVVPIFNLDLLLLNSNMKMTTWIDLQKIMRELDRMRS